MARPTNYEKKIKTLEEKLEFHKTRAKALKAQLAEMKMKQSAKELVGIMRQNSISPSEAASILRDHPMD